MDGKITISASTLDEAITKALIELQTTSEHLHYEVVQKESASSFKEDLGADSLDLFELVMALEDEYSVEIPSDDLQNLLTVGDVMNYLKEKGVEA